MTASLRDSSSNADITNESFLNAYDKLNISKINQAKNTKKVSWDQLVLIFNELKIPLCDAPEAKVSE